MDFKDNIGPFISDYKIVQAPTAEGLTIKVNNALVDGFIVHGMPFSTGGTDPAICQTLIKLTPEIKRCIDVTMQLALEQLNNLAWVRTR